jgi:hypothetical protein
LGKKPRNAKGGAEAPPLQWIEIPGTAKPI